MKENKELKQASEKLDKLSYDEKMRRIAEWREKAILSENTNLAASYQEGVTQGTEQTTEKIAINLLKKGVDISTISEATGLSIDEIEKLKNNLE